MSDIHDLSLHQQTIFTSKHEHTFSLYSWFITLSRLARLVRRPSSDFGHGTSSTGPSSEESLRASVSMRAAYRSHSLSKALSRSLLKTSMLSCLAFNSAIVQLANSLDSLWISRSWHITCWICETFALGLARISELLSGCATTAVSYITP